MANINYFINFNKNWEKTKLSFEQQVEIDEKRINKRIENETSLEEEKTINLVGLLAGSLVQKMYDELSDIIPSLFVNISTLMGQQGFKNNNNINETIAFLKKHNFTDKEIEHFKNLNLFNNKMKHIELNSKAKDFKIKNEINPIKLLDILSKPIDKLFKTYEKPDIISEHLEKILH